MIKVVPEQVDADGEVETIRNMVRAEDAEVPSSPGVYYLVGEERRLLYVGKARDLRRRLQQHARTPRWEAVEQVRWETSASETAALQREADVLAALRPPWNKAHVDGYFAFVTVAAGRVTLVAEGEYGCSPHLGKGALSESGRACIDGFDALNRIAQTTAPDQALLDKFLSGRSSALLRTPLKVDQPHIIHGIERDRRAAAGFYEHGPRAMRELRLRHGGRGSVSRDQFTGWILSEVEELLR